MAGEVWQTGWWESYLSQSIWGSTIDLVWLESRSEEICTFSPLTVPGLLQTTAYMQELFRVANPENSKTENERSVELRVKRQGILHKETPARLSTVIDEGVLRRVVGGAATMRAQLTSLREAAERPNIEIRVLPFAAGAHASPDGAFTLLKMGAPFPAVAHIESPGGAIYLERDDVDRLAQMYDRLQERSLNPDDSVAFIAALEKELS